MLTEYFLKQIAPYSYTPYTVMAAIRGPDAHKFDGDMLKSLITARIRSIVFDDRAAVPGAYQTRPLSDSDLALVQQFAEAAGTQPWYRHWAEHAISAIGTTDDHPVWGGLASQLTQVLAKPGPTGVDPLGVVPQKGNP